MNKIKLLMWKNFKILCNTKIATLKEIIFPIIPPMIFVILRVLLEIETISEPHIYEPFSVSNKVPNVVKEMCNMIYYSPSNPITDKIMQDVKLNYFENRALNYTFQAFRRDNELVKTFKKVHNGKPGRRLLAALIFENISSTSLPSEIKYTLRFPSCQRTEYEAFRDRNSFRSGWFTDFIYPVFAFRGPRSKKSSQGGFPGYFDEGFLYLQNSVDRAISNLLLNSDQRKELEEYDVQLRRFPFPVYREDDFPPVTRIVLPFLITLAFVYAIANLTKMIVHEKSTRIKEYLKLMGFDDWVHWTTWFLRAFITLSISVVLIVILLKIPVNKDEAVFTETNPLIIFVLLITTVFSAIGFSFFCSTLFDDEQIAATFAGCMWIVLEFSYLALYLNYSKMNNVGKYAVSFLASQIPMSFAMSIMCARELSGDGSQWDNFWSGENLDDTFSVGHAIIVILINGCIYFLAAFYIQLVFPGKFSYPLPWYYPLTKRYWTGRTKKSAELNPQFVQRLHENYPDRFEKDSSLPSGIEIHGMSKVFGSKVAVDNLSMKIFVNQVTVLLGHNGAGKTTLLKILAGLTQPTKGTVIVNDFYNRANMHAVRQSVGLCPQYNILFDDLTVEEHLTFSCKLKGLGKNENIEEIDHCVYVLGLEDKRFVASKDLNDSEKRKLCVGMSFSAGSKIVLLDEPTAEMDPVTRRSIWELIVAQKAGRTILLSTNYTEEADLIGDRIAIMSNGRLRCCGSSMFLKSKFGGEYTLAIVKKTDCGVDKLKQTIHNVIPDAKFQNIGGSEVRVRLPVNQIEKFSALFEKLDATKELLLFESYGVCNTTMQQIFFRVLESEENRSTTSNSYRQHQNGVISHRSSQISLSHSQNPTHSVTPLLNKYEVANTGPCLWAQQFSAMFIKKVKYCLRNKKLLLTQFIVSIAMMAFVIWLMSFYPGMSRAPEGLTFSLDKFEQKEKTTTLVNCPLNSTACQGFKAFLKCGKHNSEDIDDVSLIPVILDQIRKSYMRATGKNILGFEEGVSNTNYSKITIIGYFNNQQLHNPPLALNYITNGLLLAVGIKNKITVTSFPFDFYDAHDFDDSVNSFSKPFIVGYSVGIALAFLSATFIVLPVQERQTKFKQLQEMAGVKLPIYWLVHVLVDFSVYSICSMSMYLVILEFDVSQYKSFDIFLNYLSVTGLYGWSMICVTMLLSRFIDKAPSGYAKLIFVNCPVALIGLAAIVMLRAPDFDLKREADIAHNILLFHPNYAVASATMYLGVQNDLRKYCPDQGNRSILCTAKPTHLCCTKWNDYFDFEPMGIGRHISRMSCVGLVSLALLSILECGILRKFKACLRQCRSYKSATPKNDKGIIHLVDGDVIKETRRIAQCNFKNILDTDNLIVMNLTKMYRENFGAVNSISFGVPKGETFGILGSSGAGKTTILKLLTGGVSITSGDAFINSFSVKNNLEKARAHFGYCPQFDACLDQLTGREVLTIVARLRGILESDITLAVEKVATDLRFRTYLDKSFGSFSRSNKRKLSISLAMLGNPSTIFLDEPTAGMDPVACSHVWHAVNRARDSGTSVVLISHTFDECEALCSKIGVMVKGHFVRIGSPQHLKSKVFQGYTLVVQMSYTECPESVVDEVPSTENDDDNKSDWSTRLQEFTEFLKYTFSGCFLMDSYPGYAKYHIPQSNTTWSKVFMTLEEAKNVFHVEAYSVDQNNLEQVFFDFINGDNGE